MSGGGHRSSGVEGRARFEQLRQVFHEIHDLPRAEAQERVAAICGDDPELGREALALWDEATSLDHEAAPRPRPPLPGYHVLQLLGTGGMGEVYLAVQETLARPVALKIIAADRLSPAARRRLAREAHVLARLAHPGLAQIYESGEVQTPEGSYPFLAMQYVQGAPLADVIAEQRSTGRPLDPAWVRRLVSWIEGAARALHAAHESGVVHRDVKPRNIVITEDDRAVVIDFGIATLSGAPDITQTGPGMPGSPRYMSPEQLDARKDIDRRADVWALGVSLFEGLFDACPFEGATTHAIAESVRRGPVVIPRRARRRELRDLAAVLETALERDLDRRYATALGLADDLARFLREEPVRARRTSPLRRGWLWARRNPAVAVCLGIALLALTVGLVVSISALDSRERALVRQSAALDHARRMSDARLALQLLQKVDEMWPSRPDRLPAYADWLRMARGLLSRWPEHRLELERLRAKALPLTVEMEAQQERLRASRTQDLAFEIQFLQSIVEDLEGDLKSELPDLQRRSLEMDLAVLGPLIAEARNDWRLTERLLYEFAAPQDEWDHWTLSRLEKDCGAIERAITEVEARVAFAQSLPALTLEQPAESWKACCADVRSDPRFEGLELVPQIGLVPLGKDKGSGLWEFFVAGSGERPRWEGELHEGSAALGLETGIVLVLVPGGSFLFGAQPSDSSAPNHDPLASANVEGPPVQVQLAPFFLAKSELTRFQWRTIVGPTREPSVWMLPEDPLTTLMHPMTNIAWEETREALRRLGLDLPTEAQWERAARGGTSDVWWWGDEPDGVAERGNILGPESGRGQRSKLLLSRADPHVILAPVATLLPNPYGLYDVIGNASEWCRDWFVLPSMPPRPGDGQRGRSGFFGKTHRGGSFGTVLERARSATRAQAAPSTRDYSLGVRPWRAVER